MSLDFTKIDLGTVNMQGFLPQKTVTLFTDAT